MHELFPDGPDYNLISQLTIPAEAPFSERPLAAFSGGERIKLLLLRTLMQGPDFLVLDEPTNDLDLRALDWLERLILSSKIPVLYVSHDETLLEHTANVILHFEQIRRKTAAQHTLERMGYRAYVERRNAMLAHQEQIAAKQRADQRARRIAGSRFISAWSMSKTLLPAQTQAGAGCSKRKCTR